MGPPGFEPGTDRLCIPLQLSLPLSGLWAGLSLRPRPKRWGACRLVSTPSLMGLARDYHFRDIADLGFPEFDRYHLKVSLQAALDRSAYLNWDLADLVSGAGCSNH